jgi:GNAT superfamily N-acetyltransferase
MQIDIYKGDREPLRALLEMADEPGPLASYMNSGDILAAREEGAVIGVALVAAAREADEFEIKNMSVRSDRQRCGVGRALIEAALAYCRARGVRRLLVATAAADVGNLRFYQRAGFRMLRIERDAFTAAGGYPDAGEIDEIPLRDRVWFDRAV